MSITPDATPSWPERGSRACPGLSLVASAAIHVRSDVELKRLFELGALQSSHELVASGF